MARWARAVQWPSFVPGALCGAALAWGVQQLPYVNRVEVMAPLDHRPLVIRHDAKGDGRFGAPRSGHRRHRGVDIEAPLGSPVRAIRSGRVIASGKHRGLGRYLELEHHDDFHSLYAHLDTLAVDVGDRVRQGQAIATVGKTGNARNPLIKSHLHLEVQQAGRPLDPATMGLALLEPVGEPEGSEADGGE
ncbi:MAG: M23 family metallopeptidase [Candidatus Omnitrophica bacterium]|nr:M23 family metallopeptidase [Candidatus Omnitrophota bacterium]